MSDATRRKITTGMLLRAASFLSLVSLALIVYGLLDRSPWAMLAAMTLGQALGTAALVVCGLVILGDMRRVARARRDAKRQ